MENFLIVGLGNWEKKYLENRHNVGWRWVERCWQHLLKAYDWTTERDFQFSDKYFGELAQLGNVNCKIYFLLPHTYMNESGKAVIAVSDFFKIKSENILVVHDDLDIKIGEYKLQFQKGPKVHGGLLSTEQWLETRDFFRLRVGVENREEDSNIDGKDYVLSDFNLEQKEIIKNMQTLSFLEVEKLLKLK